MLMITNMDLKDAGMYQCFVGRDGEVAQAVAQVKLGGWFLKVTFIYCL